MSSMTEYYSHRFAGIGRIYGPEGLEKILNAHVLVIGLGGVGSWVVEALARSGVGAITLVDFDDICVSNFNRQIHAVDTTVGKFKVDAMRDRIHAINKECRVTVINDRFSEETAESILNNTYSYVIDAFDNGFGKSFLISLCKKKKLPIIVLGSVGGKIDPGKIELDDLSRSREDTLLSFVRKKLRGEYGFPSGKDKKFGVPCVFSTEKYVFLENGCLVSTRPDQQLKGLDCGGGMGAITHLSASFAFRAVSHVLKVIAQK
jgi:tRNA threonylcarbamoyladenosine dehydratase